MRSFFHIAGLGVILSGLTCAQAVSAADQTVDARNTDNQPTITGDRIPVDPNAFQLFVIPPNINEDSTGIRADDAHQMPLSGLRVAMAEKAVDRRTDTAGTGEVPIRMQTMARMDMDSVPTGPTSYADGADVAHDASLAAPHVAVGANDF